MRTCDLNCDLGEGAGLDEEIMPFISSASIACGWHAGDEKSMRETIKLALKYKVSIGAHPSFPDRENFGRTEIDCTPQQVYEWTRQQVLNLKKLAAEANVVLNHVKPHGAMYNLSARDMNIAKAIAKAVRDEGDYLAVYGLSGSWLVKEAKALGLRTASEVFADRTYQDDGSLTSRKQKGALIEDEEESLNQVLQMVRDGEVYTRNLKRITIVAETVCIHGDGKHAADFARKINQMLQENNFVIQSN